MDFTEHEPSLWRPNSPSSVTSNGEVIQQLTNSGGNLHNQGSSEIFDVFRHDDALVPNIPIEELMNKQVRKRKILAYANEIPYYYYKITFMLHGSYTERIDTFGFVRNCREHLNMRNCDDFEEEVPKQAGTVPYKIINLEVSTRQAPEQMIWSVVDLLTAVKEDFSIVFSDELYFSGENSNPLKMVARLEKMSFCSWDTYNEKTLLEHWTIRKKDNLNLEILGDKFHSEIDFAAGSVTNHVWSRIASNSLVHETVEIDMKKIKKIISSHLVPINGPIRIIFELNGSVAMKRRIVNEDYLMSEVPKLQQRAFETPDMEASNLFGNSQHMPREGVVNGCRFVSLCLDINRESFYDLLSAFHQKTGVAVEFARIKYSELFLTGDQYPFMDWTVLAPFNDSFYLNIVHKELPGSENNHNRELLMSCLLSLLDANISVKVQLLLDQRCYEGFCKDVIQGTGVDFIGTIKLLEAVTEFLKTNNRPADLRTVLQDFEQQLQLDGILS